jgi:hypothetical protein
LLFVTVALLFALVLTQPTDMQQTTNYEAIEIEECVRHIHCLHAKSKTSNLRAIFDKYYHRKTHYVAAISPAIYLQGSAAFCESI